MLRSLFSVAQGFVQDVYGSNFVEMTEQKQTK